MRRAITLSILLALVSLNAFGIARSGALVDRASLAIRSGQRTQEVYLPRGSRWRDAWHRDKVYEGGQTVRVHVELYQIPLFIRDGSPLAFGDLSQQYRESLAFAQKKPDLGKMDSELRVWFDRNKR